MRAFTKCLFLPVRHFFVAAGKNLPYATCILILAQTFMYQNGVEFHQKVIGAIANLPTHWPTRSPLRRCALSECPHHGARCIISDKLLSL